MHEGAPPLRAFNAVREQHAEVIAGHANLRDLFRGMQEDQREATHQAVKRGQLGLSAVIARSVSDEAIQPYLQR